MLYRPSLELYVYLTGSFFVLEALTAGPISPLLKDTYHSGRNSSRLVNRRTATVPASIHY
jgi:hypothetical protein